MCQITYKQRKIKNPRDSLFKAVDDPRADTTCYQTRNVYEFHEKEDIKLIWTNRDKEKAKVFLFKAISDSLT